MMQVTLARHYVGAYTIALCLFTAWISSSPRLGNAQPTHLDMGTLHTVILTYVAITQVSLARACGGAYTTALCLFTALGAAFFAIQRTKADPGTGVLTNLGFYLTVLTGQFTWPAKLFWRQVCNHCVGVRVCLARALNVVHWLIVGLKP